MNGWRKLMGRDSIASRATRPKSRSVLRQVLVKRSRKAVAWMGTRIAPPGPTIDGRQREASRLFRYEANDRGRERRCLGSRHVEMGGATMRVSGDHRKFQLGRTSAG